MLIDLFLFVDFLLLLLFLTLTFFSLKFWSFVTDSPFLGLFYFDFLWLALLFKDAVELYVLRVLLALRLLCLY